MSFKIFFLISTLILTLSCTEHQTHQNETSHNKNKTTDIETIQETIDTAIIELIETEEDIKVKEINLKTNQILETKENKTQITQQTSTKPQETIIEDVEPVIKENIKDEVLKPNHQIWNDLLKKNVSSTGKVNYKALKNNKKQIDDYINQLTSFTTQTDWSKNEKLAYWINLYNAVTIQLILNHYPIKSITDLHGGKPWDKKLVSIGTKSYSLNNIENDIIRPKFNDARIHFAVNCAAKSCPKLLNGAFLPEKLNYQLNKQTKAFVNGSKNDITADAISISKIFEWYRDDFSHGDIIAFLNQYSTTTINPNASISFKEYDWNLNE